jgi:hypothetical protein
MTISKECACLLSHSFQEYLHRQSHLLSSLPKFINYKLNIYNKEQELRLACAG